MYTTMDRPTDRAGYSYCGFFFCRDGVLRLPTIIVYLRARLPTPIAATAEMRSSNIPPSLPITGRAVCLTGGKRGDCPLPRPWPTGDKTSYLISGAA